MKVIVVGATGTIGKEVVNLLSSGHELVRVVHRSGDLRVDITSKASIDQLYRTVGPFDAVISTTGLVKFGSFNELTDEDYMLGLTSKLMGQVNLVRIGLNYINDRGSFTLTSGVLSQHPIPEAVPSVWSMRELRALSGRRLSNSRAEFELTW